MPDKTPSQTRRARLWRSAESHGIPLRAILVTVAEHCGIGTGGWWQEQLDLCLIGVMATFGWEKALGDAGELSWWEAAAADAATRQHIPIPG